MKIKNKDLEPFISLYSKFVNADYDDFDLALNITKDGFKIEELSKAFGKLKEGFLNKHKDEQGNVSFKDEKVIKEFEKLLETTQDAGELTQIPKSLLKTIKVKGIEAKLLSDYELIKD